MKPWKDLEELETHVTKWQRPTWEGYMLRDSDYVTFWKRRHCEDREKGSGGRGGGRRRAGGAQRIPRAGQITLCDFIMMAARRHAFLQTQKTYSTKSEP